MIKLNHSKYIKLLCLLLVVQMVVFLLVFTAKTSFSADANHALVTHPSSIQRVKLETLSDKIVLEKTEKNAWYVTSYFNLSADTRMQEILFSTFVNKTGNFLKLVGKNEDAVNYFSLSEKQAAGRIQFFNGQDKQTFLISEAFGGVYIRSDQNNAVYEAKFLLQLGRIFSPQTWMNKHLITNPSEIESIQLVEQKIVARYDGFNWLLEGKIISDPTWEAFSANLSYIVVLNALSRDDVRLKKPIQTIKTTNKNAETVTLGFYEIEDNKMILKHSKYPDVLYEIPLSTHESLVSKRGIFP